MRRLLAKYSVLQGILEDNSNRMEIVCVRTGKRDNWFYVKRDDGSELSWPWPDEGLRLPHDFIHALVERHFGIADAFWDRVNAGAEIRSLHDQSRAGHQPVRYERPGIRLAEALVGTLSTAETAGWTDKQCLEETRRCIDGLPQPENLSEASLGEIRAEIDAWTAR